MKLKTKLFLSLILFAVFDTVIPIPFTAILLIYVISEKPQWFKKLVQAVYEN